MSIYNKSIQDLNALIKKEVRIVKTAKELSIYLANEFCNILEQKQKNNEMLTVILPVGPIDYTYFAKEINKRNLSLKNLRTINMDEYLDEDDKFISIDHPMSFRKFMIDSFFSKIPEERRPENKNIMFPDPESPESITQIIDEIGGADICWGGFGISGHIAFNDPPSMFGEPEDLESFLNCKTRKISISPVSNAQMLMGGSFGNDEILPKRAVTIGIYEVLKSKKLHLTFLRNWHRGLWRRAFFGPVGSEFPGSVVQRHENVEIIMTESAAQLPLAIVSQSIGE